MSHLTVESVSAYIRTKSYFLDAETTSSQVVVAKSIGKIKQAVSMLGTALALIPETQILGGALLWLSLPLSYLSLKDKIVAKPKPRILVSIANPFTAEHIQKLFELSSKYEIVLRCDEETEKLAALHLGDFIYAVLPKKNGSLTIETLRPLELSHVFVDDTTKLDVDLKTRYNVVIF